MRIPLLLLLTLFLLLTVTIPLVALRTVVTTKMVNFGVKKATNRSIDAIIVHSVYNSSGGDEYDVDLIIKQFSTYNVSAHYLIGRDGEIIQLVKEADIAYHAGVSRFPDGSRGVNSRSIGIEVITSLTDAPTLAQMNATADLIKDIQSRNRINYVLRHSDIAPGRKTDPWNMDWETLLTMTASTL